MQEIERKFICKAVPFDATFEKPLIIKQAYLARSDCNSEEVRVREEDLLGEKRYYLTAKKGKGEIREETEINISDELYSKLTENIDVFLEKTRIPFWHRKYLYILDCYNTPKVDYKIVEVEFEDVVEASAFTPPDWLGEEVTNNMFYSNSFLYYNKVKNRE